MVKVLRVFVILLFSNFLITESIETFYNQEELKNIIKKNGFSDVEFRNLSGGISAIHMGWKI